MIERHRSFFVSTPPPAIENDTDALLWEKGGRLHHSRKALFGD